MVRGGRFEDHLLLVLRIQLGVLGFEEDQLVVCGEEDRVVVFSS